MSTIIELIVPTSELAMQQTLTDTPETTVEIERVVAHESGTLTPYFWIRGGDRERFETAITTDPSVSEAKCLDVHENASLYRAEWPADVDSVGHAFLQTGATILEATGRDEKWELRLRFDTHDDLSTFHDYCEDHDIAYVVERIYNPVTPKGGGQFGVSPKQHEALVTALEAGYYDIDRGVTMTDVSEELGISQQALSKRLKRAHGNLVNNALTVVETDRDT